MLKPSTHLSRPTSPLCQNTRFFQKPPDLFLTPFEKKFQELPSQKNKKKQKVSRSDQLIKQVKALLGHHQLSEAIQLVLAYLRRLRSPKELEKIQKLGKNQNTLSRLIHKLEEEIIQIPDQVWEALNPIKILIPSIVKGFVAEFIGIYNNPSKMQSAIALSGILNKWIRSSSKESAQKVLKPMTKLFKFVVSSSTSITKVYLKRFCFTFSILESKSQDYQFSLIIVRIVRDFFAKLKPIGSDLLDFCERRVFSSLKIEQNLHQNFKIILEYSGMI